MKLYTIDTGFFKLDGGAMFGVVPKSVWNKFHPADDPASNDHFLRKEKAGADKVWIR